MNDGHINASMDIDNASLDVTFGEVYEIDKGMPAAIIANLYSSQSTYSPGDYVIYRSRLYKCLVAIETPEEFDSEKWELVKVAEELKEKADKSTTYTKTETNALLDEKADVNNVYTKTETDAFLDEKANSDNVYTKAEADVLLDEKADRQSTLAALSTLSDAIDTKADAAGTVAALALKADKTYVDIELDKKADKSSTYTKTEVDTALASKAAADSVYTKLETDEVVVNATEGKADTTYVNTELDKKADKTDTYTKTQVDNALNNKMNKANPTGTGSISVGSNMLNIGSNSQTFGSNTKALGNNAFATGENTQASVANQFVFGKYNQYSFGNLVEIVGNGTSESNRSNARTLDWQGNETLAGNLTFNGNKSLTSEISRLDGKIDTKANASDVYTKSQADTLLNGKANASDVYTKQATDALLNDKADVSDLPDMSQYYDKSEVDDLLDDKANSDDVYGKAYIDTALSGKANVGTSYTKSEEDALLANKADADNTYTKAQVDDIVYGILPDDTASGSVANFATSLEMPIKSLEVDVNAVQESGTPTPTTPLPISGWSEISVVSCHKNLYRYDESKVSTGTTTTSTTRAYYPLGFKGVTSLTFTANLKSGSSITASDYLNIGKLRKSDGLIEILSQFITPNGITTRTLSISSDDDVVLVSLENPTVIKSILSRYDIQIEVSSSATSFEPFNGNTEVINLGGTYYGGHFTQDKDGHRQFKVTYSELLDMGDLTWANFSPADNIFRANVPNCKSPADNTDRKNGFLCSIYPASSNVSINANMTDKSLLRFGGYLVLRDTSYSDYTELASSLSGAKLIYELATPIIIDLPDGEPIITLNGTNNIFADTGDTSVVFKDSVNGYVEKKIASVQALALNT